MYYHAEETAEDSYDWIHVASSLNDELKDKEWAKTSYEKAFEQIS